MRNRWKTAFWICLLLLGVTVAMGAYAVLDQAVTLTHLKEGYSDTEADLETMMQIINQTDLSKQKVKRVLEDHELYEYMNFNSDTISLDRVSLTFESGKLKYVTKQW